MEYEETQKNRRCSWSLARPFQMISISLLSLLVPLSFLFLSRLSFSSAPVTVSRLSSFLHQADVGVLYTILSLIIVSTLIHNLSGKPECSVFHSHLYICWIVLFIVQACVAFGIEGTMSTIMTTVPDKSFLLASPERWVLVRVMFFLGLHEVMLMWFRVVVKPVVDDTVFGVYVEEEKWSERTVVAVTFGLMWWWRLRDEVESLVVVAEAKRNLLIRLGGFDIVNWWMYYICVVIGIVKIFKGFLYFVNMLILTIKRPRKECESLVVVVHEDHV
ncbi:unnamed protein product [Microthlaspi erraticum]|uniref:Transmembrane protein n=1 Tax=Microthlaspi erraticum TaxID=1685480 RepID=A0A6D2L8N4_9BRAS|nr:unnamed protein product [Microthlaspi erraticum]